MKKLFASFLCVLGLASCTKPILSSSAFTEEFATKLRQAMPRARIEIVRDLELRVTGAAVEETAAFLYNCYTEYRASPQDQEATISKYIKAFSEAGFNINKIDVARITPVIKDRAWISGLQATLLARGAKKTLENVYDELNQELLIVYVEDSPKSLRYLTAEDLVAVGLKKEQLRELAVKNLRGLMTKVDAQGEEGFYMVTAGGNYEASLVLLDEVWKSGKMKVNGDYVIAIPTRDLLLVTGSNEKASLAKVRTWAKEAVAESAYRLTSDLFIYKDGKLTKFAE